MNDATTTFTTRTGRTVVDGVEEPLPVDLVRELRRRLGLFDGAMDKTPRAAWEEALLEVDRLMQWSNLTPPVGSVEP